MSGLSPSESYYCRWQVSDNTEIEGKEGVDLAEVIRLLGSYTDGYLSWLDIQCGDVDGVTATVASAFRPVLADMAKGLCDIAELVGLPRDTDEPEVIAEKVRFENQRRDDLIVEFRKQLTTNIRTVEQQQAEIKQLKAEQRIDGVAEVTREELREFLGIEGGSPENESKALHEAFVIFRREGGAL